MKEQDVGRNVCAGVGPERGVRQTEGPEQYRAFRQVFPNRRILLVHCVATRNERDQTARSDHVKRLREEVIVDAASQVRTAPISRIEDRVVAERDVADGRVEEISRKSNIFEGFAVNVRIRVEFGGDAGRNRVQFDAGAPCACVQAFRHESEKMPNAHRGFEDVATRPKSESLHPFPDRLDDFWRRVMRIRRGCPRRCVLLGGQSFPQFVSNTFPLS